MNLDIINSQATLIPCNYLNVVAGFIITSEGSGRFFYQIANNGCTYTNNL